MEEELVERYLGTATQLEQAPFDRELHLVHLDLLQQLNLVDELAQARLALLQCYPLTTAQWLAWFADSRAKLDDAQAHVDLLELFGRASQDYVSIPLLLVYSTHTIAAYYAAHGLAPPPPLDEDEDDPDVQMQTDGVDSRKTGDVDEVLSAVYSLKVCRQIREEVLAIGGTHLSQSHKLWNVWRDFEMDLLRMSTNAEQLAVLDALYLARLEVPHIGIDQTFAAYSSLITKYNNSAYSTALPAANKLYAIAKKAVELREVKEAELSKGKFASWAYLNYIRWELEVKKPDIELVKSLFERAVYDCAERVGPVKELEEVWDEYFAFATATPKKFVNLVNIADRAVRSCPASGLLWANHFRVSERFKLGADVVEAAFERATATRLLEGQVEQLIVLYEARADFHRREVDALVGSDDVEGDMIDLVIAILLEGITKVKAIKGADAQLRLEKYLIRQYERFNRVDEARQVWADLTTRYSHNYAVWYGRADFETRRGTAKMAHEVYLAGCSARHLDYPEYLLQAWLAFEHQNGTLSDLEFARVKGGRMTRGIEARRRREGLAAGPALAASTADADDFIASAVQDSSMDVSTAQKRERDEMAPPEGTGNAKKIKVEAAPAAAAAGVPEEQKRDRENSTVFVVSPLEAQTTEEDLKRLFADCGEVRECKVKTIGEQHLAMVEFMEKDSVLAAQTKDKKRIRNVEVDVHIAWKSCLYVTNFPESYDKAKVEELFAPFGTIFDTRWPSKRFKNTRRFCYVQFTLAESAEAALSLHNTTLDDSKLVVYISDPGRKKGRSDANANAKELYVAGLSKFVKEADLKRLFEPYGTIKGIRVSLDDKAECRGFAFVEYEDEAAAIASLALNNHELKKRRMSVTIAQSRIVGTQKVVEGSGERKADADSKNLRVRGIPPGTEEPIVQQAFERFAKVRRVLMEEGSSEATIEFEDDAEAGKALMAKASIKIDDVDLEIFTEGAQLRTIDGKKPSAVKSSGGDVKLLPRQASRGRGRVGLRGNRRGVGARAGAINVSSTTPMAVDSSSTVGTNKTQDDFRAMLNKK